MKKTLMISIMLLTLLCSACTQKSSSAKTSGFNVKDLSKSNDSLEVIPKDESNLSIINNDLEGKSYSELTGELIDKNIADKRPVAFVINNIRKALPQSGISQADIYYEVIAEGDITRIIALFQDYNINKIGPIRSARHYFLDFALDNDAIFVHHGGSPQAYSSINTLKINDLDGMADTVSFFRDPNRVNIAGMYEHSSFINGISLTENLQNRYRMDKLEDFKSGFNFYPLPTIPMGYTETSKVTVPFSAGYISVFEYDDKSKLYNKFHEDEKHMDVENNEQLAVTNILVQNVTIDIINGDEYGRREVGLIGKGTGYLITNGVYIPISWSKQSHTEPTRWFNVDGSKLQINKGKTWICVFNGDVQFE
jgi:hypothetical protein